jgi:hypothetical protein
MRCLHRGRRMLRPNRHKTIRLDSHGTLVAEHACYGRISATISATCSATAGAAVSPGDSIPTK